MEFLKPDPSQYVHPCISGLLRNDPANRDLALSGPYLRDLDDNPSSGIFPMNALLPECLERADGGIRITGHRVSLFRILDAIFDGVSIERMREMFPTIPPRKLSDVVTFCNQQIEEMRSYHAEQKARFAALEAGRVTEGPSIEELHRRRSIKHQSESAI